MKFLALTPTICIPCTNLSFSFVLKGTEAVEGLFLDMSKITDLELSSEAFTSMHNLKYLKFYVSDWRIGAGNVPKVHLPRGLEYLSDDLRYLYWHGYPLKALPPNFNPKNLVELHMPHSNVERLPKESMVWLKN